jgi:hypothetical protein
MMAMRDRRKEEHKEEEVHEYEQHLRRQKRA